MSGRHNWHRRPRATSTTTELSLPRAPCRLLAGSLSARVRENWGAKLACSRRSDCKAREKNSRRKKIRGPPFSRCTTQLNSLPHLLPRSTIWTPGTGYCQITCQRSRSLGRAKVIHRPILFSRCRLRHQNFPRAWWCCWQLAGLADICRLSRQASIMYKSIFIIYLTPLSNSVDCVLRLSSLFLESFWIMKAFSFYLYTFITFCLLQSGK